MVRGPPACVNTIFTGSLLQDDGTGTCGGTQRWSMGADEQCPRTALQGMDFGSKSPQGMTSMCQVDCSGLSCRVGTVAPRSLGCSRDGAEGLKRAILLCKGHPFCPPTPGKRHQ